MGLDMYAMMTRQEPHTDVDFSAPEAETLHEWRKHPNLHGWMQDLYYEKGGAKDVFNCTTVRLEAEDLDRLADAIKERTLPETVGFFFGESSGDEYLDDLEFVAKARAAIEKGYTVFYDSWW